MKLDAEIEFIPKVAEELGTETATVTVDMDYVSDDEEEIKNWCATELREVAGRELMLDEFKVANMADLMKELAYDEFKRKTEV